MSNGVFAATYKEWSLALLSYLWKESWTCATPERQLTVFLMAGRKSTHFKVWFILLSIQPDWFLYWIVWKATMKRMFTSLKNTGFTSPPTHTYTYMIPLNDYNTKSYFINFFPSCFAWSTVIKILHVFFVDFAVWFHRWFKLTFCIFYAIGCFIPEFVAIGSSQGQWSWSKLWDAMGNPYRTLWPK